jgi:hypothetical protein
MSRAGSSLRALFLILAFLGVGVVAHADTIGPDCSTCQGSTYTLVYNPIPVASTSTTATFEFTYIIDTSTFTGPADTYVQAVGMKVSSNNLSVVLVEAPGGVDKWVASLGSLSNAADSCHANSGAPFACADISASDFGDFNNVGGTLQWKFHIEMGIAALLDGEDEASIKARYSTLAGNKVGPILSESITVTRAPEPSALALLGSGLLALGFIGRFRRT